MRPEPADNGRDGFRGPEFCSRKTGVLSRRRGGESCVVSCVSRRFYKLAHASLLHAQPL